MKQTINITAVDPVDFVNRLLELGKKGAVLKDRTFPRLKAIPFAVSLEVEVVEEIKTAPGINAIPVAEDQKWLSKEELEGLEWETLKSVCKTVGVTGRDRDQIIRKYLEKAPVVVDE